MKTCLPAGASFSSPEDADTPYDEKPGPGSIPSSHKMNPPAQVQPPWNTGRQNTSWFNVSSRFNSQDPSEGSTITTLPTTPLGPPGLSQPCLYPPPNLNLAQHHHNISPMHLNITPYNPLHHNLILLQEITKLKWENTLLKQQVISLKWIRDISCKKAETLPSKRPHKRPRSNDS